MWGQRGGVHKGVLTHKGIGSTVTSVTTKTTAVEREAHPLEGRVLSTYERNHYDDSDFYAVYWDEESQSVQEKEIGSTRGAAGWPYNVYDLPHDADEETVAKAEAYLRRVYAQARADVLNAEAKVPEKGRRVRLTRDVKFHGDVYAEGTEGVVFWHGLDRYKTSRWTSAYRVGIEADGVKFFAAADAVEVIDPEVVTADDVEINRVSFNRPSDVLFAYSNAVFAAERKCS